MVKLRMHKILKKPVIQRLYPTEDDKFQGTLTWIQSFMIEFGSIYLSFMYPHGLQIMDIYFVISDSIHG
ncbi:uncharacterized protein OCT59_001249 [Rhizophagus irregularis]|uniref:uncharacterized protein n=1 Tax=Rhizophagus irregularis TaxID=588596 RepID=UPI003324A28B|nr:hypothetical protein OCT59_001249 [Rhizophagus irregularis]